LLKCKPGPANIPFPVGVWEKLFANASLSHVVRAFTPQIACLLFKHWRKAKYNFKTQHRYLSFSPPPNDSVSWDERFSKRLICRRFCKISKASNHFVISVCLSTWSNSASTGMIFIKIYILTFFSNICRENSIFIEIRQE
jgi:hypothetical protein